jgi:hypothetical protein
MHKKLGIVVAVIVGSVLVSCAQDAIRSAMDPDAGTDGQVVRADGAAAAGECCEPPAVPQPVVIHDGGLVDCKSPVLDVSAFRRVIIHSSCGGLDGAYIRYRHGEVGFARESNLASMCGASSQQVLSIDPQLGREIQYLQGSCAEGTKLTVVGYR